MNKIVFLRIRNRVTGQIEWLRYDWSDSPDDQFKSTLNWLKVNPEYATWRMHEEKWTYYDVLQLVKVKGEKKFLTTAEYFKQKKTKVAYQTKEEGELYRLSNVYGLRAVSEAVKLKEELKATWSLEDYLSYEQAEIDKAWSDKIANEEREMKPMGKDQYNNDLYAINAEGISGGLYTKAEINKIN